MYFMHETGWELDRQLASLKDCSVNYEILYIVEYIRAVNRNSGINDANNAVSYILQILFLLIRDLIITSK